MRTAYFLATAGWLLIAAGSPTPQPNQITYTLKVDQRDLGAFSVEMHIVGAADSFTLAAAAHPEYDDKYWRYLEDLQVLNASGTPANVTRADSVLWRVTKARGDVVVRYRVRLPETLPPRAAWRPFLSSTGGLLGGPHSFLYVFGRESAHAVVVLDIPPGWDVATGLRADGQPRTYLARDMSALMDSPIFVGQFSAWRFRIGDASHRVIYWNAANASVFDTLAFVDGIRRFAREAIQLFGSAPYRDYTFVFQDGAYGGLEHANSVTLGAPSSDLARNPNAYLPETAHEFFHTWNLMRIRPAEYRSIDYRTQPPVAGLWFSEGLTIFYADLLRRRARLPVADSTRIAHLERLLERYYSSPGNARFAAEAVSRVAYNAPPGALGDYDASTHLQGEIIGTMLDIIIRNATDGKRSMDDVMRRMLSRFSGQHGFTSDDIEAAITKVCRCGVKPFFDAHVHSGNPIDFDRYLALIGLHVRVTSAPATSRDGRPLPDLRMRAWRPPSSDRLALLLWHPASVWSRAGLHTGDQLIAISGAHPTTPQEFRDLFATLQIGDTARVQLERAGHRDEVAVPITGFERPVVTIEATPAASAQQLRLRDAWLASD